MGFLDVVLIFIPHGADDLKLSCLKKYVKESSIDSGEA
jgi:hypothetical protein